MGRLAIIAGKGRQPVDIRDVAVSNGETPLIIRLEEHCAFQFSDDETADFSLGQLGAALEYMKNRGCDRIVAAGKINRPPLNPLTMDADTIRLLGKVLLKGDDSALKIVSHYLQDKGFQFLPVSMFLADRYIPFGFSCGRSLQPAELASAKIAIQLLDALGSLDVGQAAIIQGERVLAIEAAEGTDAMIARAASFVYSLQPEPLFVKMAKTNQDKNQDPPGFGLATLHQLAQHNIRLAILEPEAVFLVEHLDVIEKEAKSAGITILASDVVLK